MYRIVVPWFPSQTTIDLVVCYIRMFISGPFKQLFISFWVMSFSFCVCVCASTTSFLFCCHLRHEFCVCPLDHALAHPRLHLRWFSMQKKKHNEKDWKNPFSSRLSFQFILPCVCVCVLMYYSIFWIQEEKSFCRRHLRPIISSHHTTVKSHSKKKSFLGPWNVPK